MVEEHADRVKQLKSTQEITAFITEIGCKTQQRWGKAVAAIIECGGPDYYWLRGETRAASAEALRQSTTHEVELYVDAKARCQRFAITDAAGQPVWYGIFFEDDQSFSYGDRNEQSACECAAARKAIWLASKIKEAAGQKAINLVLNVDASWLVTLAGKATILATDARRFNIDLHMNWVPGTTNPADKFTIASGYRKWDSERLEKYAVPITNEPEPSEEITLPESRLEILHPPTAAEIEAKRIAEEQQAARLAALRETDRLEKLDRAKTDLVVFSSRLARGLRFGTDRKITTVHQFESCISQFNRVRETLSMPPLTAEEITAFNPFKS